MLHIWPQIKWYQRVFGDPCHSSRKDGHTRFVFIQPVRFGSVSPSKNPVLSSPCGTPTACTTKMGPQLLYTWHEVTGKGVGLQLPATQRKRTPKRRVTSKCAKPSPTCSGLITREPRLVRYLLQGTTHQSSSEKGARHTRAGSTVPPLRRRAAHIRFATALSQPASRA